MNANSGLDIDDVEAGQRSLFEMLDQADTVSGAVLVRPSAYTRGPWDHSALHGGPVCGIAAWAAEREVGSADLMCGRLTVELLSSVPLADLVVSATTVKPGRRSRVVDVEVNHNGALVARASSQWVRPAPTGSSRQHEPPRRPEEPADPGSGDVEYPRPGFNADAAELRYLVGSNEESGPSIIWARLTSPVIAGEATSALARVAAISDFAAAAGWEEGVGGAAHINPDSTLQLMRYPTGAWIAVDARNRQAVDAIGYNDALLYDEIGPIGRVLQSLVEAPASPLTTTSPSQPGNPA